MSLNKFNSQQEVIAWVQSFQRFGISPGLQRVQWLLDELDNPEKSLKIIHVAGTNGKGSTCKYLAKAIEANGYRVGLFTSPYLEAFNNRIAINQADINQQSLCLVAEQVNQVINSMPQNEFGDVTEFEVITVMALLYYSLQNIDYVVLEVGLGGRLDATNVVSPIISVITNIGYDHINILGSCLADIAFEKAGIIKNGIPVISGVKQLEAVHVIREQSRQKNSKLYELGKDFYNKIDNISLEEMSVQFRFDNEQFRVDNEQLGFNNGQFLNVDTWPTRLTASYQADNLAVALATLKILQEQELITLEAAKTQEGIMETFWPGRFEVMQKNPLVIVDGAHNPEGFQALTSSLEAQFGADKKYIWCIGFLQDKKIDKMIQFIIEKASTIVITMPISERSATVELVEEEFKKEIENKIKENIEELPTLSSLGDINIYTEKDIFKAIEITLRAAKQDEIICVAGSLYMISEARNWWTNKEQRLVKE
ncbi:bifunctional folylpolyglutamate synthase/dihydrofolate synthase [Desulfuribacillus alkaliarsenatis]|uniref:tetrahydrofolate synthase n=1 Tax=Desulfuribacillus alkaliarsenatis TaxID=766136 RepID=A0A1E5G556_9FIRM|nr:folylpolyglutamate synthase/dihydrofolate synthase family protein [Desulfuribacillus alkaliarsenatis]OEF98317.1 hypothetical protein BHF68_01155 [Desulfuribacillus alkaliarsenatis]